MASFVRFSPQEMRTLIIVVLCACTGAAQPATTPSTADKAAPSGATHTSANLPESWFPVDVVNRSLPDWVQFGGEYRSRLEAQTGLNFAPRKAFYLLSRFRFETTIEPRPWLAVFAQLQDARVWFNNRNIHNTPSLQDDWDLRQAYLRLGSQKEGWIDLTVGRQILEFGDARVIGPSDWTNTARTFDAVLVNMHRAHSKVSIFASSVVVERSGVLDHHNPGNNLYGVYVSLGDAIPKARLEPYVLWRVAPSDPVLTASSFPGKLSQVTTGVRFAGTLPGDFDYNVEMTRQSGSVGPRSIAAWAGYWQLGKTFERTPAKPRLFVESNYASGTRNPRGDTWSTYDEIYPSEHDKLGFADQIGRRNIRQVRAGVEQTFGKVQVREAYMSFWLATVNDGLYTNAGSSFLPANPTVRGSHVAQELDLIAEYAAKKGVGGGFGYARILAGTFLKAATPGKSYSYPFVYLNYRF